MTLSLKFRSEMSEIEWDNYVNSLGNYSFQYQSISIEYYKQYSKYIQADLSFLAFTNNQCISCALIFLEKVANSYQFTSANSYLPAPIISMKDTYRHQEHMLDDFMNEILRIAKSRNVNKIMFRLDPLNNPDSLIKIYNYNYLMKYHFFNESINTRIIDLRLPEEELWTDVSRGTKHHIKQGAKIYQLEMYHSENITPEIFSTYQQIHFKASSRITRPIITFDLMYQWILQNKAYLFITKYKGKSINSIIVYYLNGTAYYASGADNPDIDYPKPVGHFAQWSIIKQLKTSGLSHYEMGWQQYSQQQYDKPSQKEINISNYKSKFGGYSAPLFRGTLHLTNNETMED